jgi:hypothetical protein
MLWGWSAGTEDVGSSAGAGGQSARGGPRRARKPLPSKTTPKAPSAIPTARTPQRRKTPP